ncbi:MAG: hypothetical protein WBO16_11585, partial [Gammaproteobacteria bacterium]
GGVADRQQMARKARLPEAGELDMTEVGSLTDAVDQFDQFGEQQDPDAGNTGQKPQEGGEGSAYMTLVEQQLDGIEGDPAQLLHNRFKLEERRRLRPRSLGGAIYEHRPW